MKNWKYIEGAKTGNIAADITTDGNTWFVTTSDGKKKEFPSEREAEAYVKKIKTGNDTPWEYAHRKPKVINEDKTGAEEFFKKLSDDVKEREEKDDADIEKVGNARYTTREDVISHLDTDLYDICKKVPAGSPSFAYVSELQKKGWDISTISKYTKEIGKIIDQYKVGNKKLKFTDKQDGLKEFVYDEENDKGYIYYDGKLVDTISHAGQGWLNLIKQKAFSSGVMNKIGNKVVWKEGPYRIEEVEKDGKFGFYNIPKGSFNAYRNSVLYGNFKTLDSAKAKMNEEIRLDKEYNRKYTTNSKIGNSAYDDGAKKGKEDKRKGKLITAAGFEYHAPGYSSLSFKEKEEYKKGYYSTNDLKKEDIYKWGNSASEYEILKQDPSKMHPMYKKAYEEAMKKLAREDEEFKKRFEKEYGVKAKNEASDDKFAYVMREFDEGKLKTPDGKVVTDPAQAKAIAYSESKKTENGLARARNAMAGNKKAIGSYFNMNNYGIEVGQWSWDWKNGAPDKKTMDDTARKIKDYVRQIDKNVPDGDNDERDEVFAKLDRFMHSQGLK